MKGADAFDKNIEFTLLLKNLVQLLEILVAMGYLKLHISEPLLIKY